jgi:hypothetical protein
MARDRDDRTEETSKRPLPQVIPKDSSLPAAAWNPPAVPYYRRRGFVALGGLCVFGVIGFLVSAFLQMRGVVSIFASRVCLIAAASLLIAFTWTVVYNLRLGRLRGISIALASAGLIGYMAYKVDELTLPAPATGPIVLAATFMHPQALSITVENKSNRTAEGITWEAFLYRRSDATYLSFETQAIGYVKPHSTGASYSMNLENIIVQTDGNRRIAQGEHLIGTVAVDCPQCEGMTYVLYLVWGNSGWQYELKGQRAKLLAIRPDYPEEVKKNAIKSLEDSIPMNERVAIP